MKTEQPIDAYTSALSGEGATARKVALADLLWTAANEHLWDERGCAPGREANEFSCHAVERAETGHDWNEMTQAVRFLYDLGCDFNYCDTAAWHWLLSKPSYRRQGVRYMWLLLAMHVAADEGIQIEVPA
jgi:hypothetical protein